MTPDTRGAAGAAAADAPRRCLVIANLVHASPRIPGLLGYSTEFGWAATVITPEGTLHDPRVRKPRSFNEAVHVVEVPGHGDVFWPLRAVMPSRAPDHDTSTKGPGESPWRDRLRHLAHLWLAYPDTERTWIRPLLDAARRATDRVSYDLILSSSPHPSMHIVALRLARDLGLPWVADFRDNWSHNHNYPYGRLRHRLDERLERKTLAGANLLTASTPLIARTLRMIHRRDARVVINGFIASEAGAPPPALPLATPPPKGTLLVTYLGSMYQGHQDPLPFFRAVAELAAKDPSARDQIRIRFIGDRARWVEPLVRTEGLLSMVEFVGEVPAATADVLLRESGVLLLVGWRGVETLLTKMFEYLKAGREVLVIGEPPGSEACHVIETTGAGTVARSSSEILAALERYRAEVKKGGRVPFRGDPQRVADFDYRGRAREYFGLLDEVVGPKPSVAHDMRREGLRDG